MFTSHLICRRLIPQVRNTPILHHSKIPQFTSRAIRSTSRHNTLSRVRVQKTPFEEIPTNKGPILPTTIAKAFLFTGAFSAGCFMGATIWEYESARSLMLERAKKSKFPWSRQAEDKSHYFAHVRKDISTFWNSLSQGERVFAPICALNLVVFALWRVPRLQNVMMTYFCSNPAARIVCWPMFLSTMSHYSLFHIFANMYVLHSFSSPAVLALGKEQFTAMYLSAGVIASLASVVVKTVTKTPGLSLGASGAIMAILAYVCTKFPDTQLSILFLPMVTFPAGSAIKVIMGLDLAGVLFGWKFFDHAAHLGGAAFGVFWAFYGQELWQKRIKFLSMYHDWRKTNH